MTDDEIRRIGQDFIDGRKRIWAANAMQLDPGTIAHGEMRWDYIDPFRMGMFVLTKAGKDPTAWVVDFDHIAHLCTNPSAFKKAPPSDSARVGEFTITDLPATTLITAGGEPAGGVDKTTFDGFWDAASDAVDSMFDDITLF